MTEYVAPGPTPAWQISGLKNWCGEQRLIYIQQRQDLQKRAVVLQQENKMDTEEFRSLCYKGLELETNITKLLQIKNALTNFHTMMKSQGNDVKLEKGDWVPPSPGPSVWTGSVEKPKFDESPKDSASDKASSDRVWKNRSWRWTQNDGWVDLTNTTVIGGDVWINYNNDDSPGSASSATWTRAVHDVELSPNQAQPKRFKTWNVDEEAMKAWTPEEKAAYLLQLEAEHKSSATENN